MGGPSSSHPHGHPLGCSLFGLIGYAEHLWVNQFHLFNADETNSRLYPEITISPGKLKKLTNCHCQSQFKCFFFFFFYQILCAIFKLSLKENQKPFCLMNLPLLCITFSFACWWMRAKKVQNLCKASGRRSRFRLICRVDYNDNDSWVNKTIYQNLPSVLMQQPWLTPGRNGGVKTR